MATKTPKVSVVIVGYKAKRYIDSCLKSIKSQTLFSQTQIEVIFIDNGSFDRSIDQIKRNYKWVRTLRNMKNLGYPAALNQGINYASGEYILIMNPDSILEKDYLEKAVARMERDKSIAAVCGKIYQYDFNRSQILPYLDSVGYFAFMNMFLLTASGSQDFGQFEDPTDILSVTNTCALYRKRALDDAKMKLKSGEEYFDKDFFMFLEDVDMCWRLRLLGWKISYLPYITSFHCTDIGKQKALKDNKYFKQKFFLRNKALMIIKNAMFMQFVWGMFTFLQHTFFALLKCRKKRNMDIDYDFAEEATSDCFSKVSAAFEKRRYIMSRKRVDFIKVKKWFLKKDSAMYMMYRSKNLIPYEKVSPFF